MILRQTLAHLVTLLTITLASSTASSQETPRRIDGVPCEVCVSEPVHQECARREGVDAEVVDARRQRDHALGRADGAKEGEGACTLRLEPLIVENAEVRAERDERWTLRRVVGTVVVVAAAGYAGGRVHQWAKRR